MNSTVSLECDNKFKGCSMSKLDEATNEINELVTAPFETESCTPVPVPTLYGAIRPPPPLPGRITSHDDDGEALQSNRNIRHDTQSNTIESIHRRSVDEPPN